MKRFLILFSFAALICGRATAHDVAADMADAANAWLSTLSDEQKAKAVFDWSNPDREDWHFIPKPFEGEGMRGGLPMKEQRADQRHLAYALLNTGLSSDGFTTAVDIMSLEHVLWEIENAPKRDTEMYYFSIFGTPGSKNWSWTVEGHHLSLNFTVADGKLVSGTPCFFGSNPAEIKEGPRKGFRALGAEEDAGRSLVKSLSDEQKAMAIYDKTAPKDVLTSADSKVSSLGDAGIPYTKLKDEQKKALSSLIDIYIHRLRPEVADEELAEINKVGLDKVLFAWAGGIEKGDPHYYRVQGPTFLLEYDDTQNGANHIHAVWRDFDGDFGRDLLKEHYQAYHKAK